MDRNELALAAFFAMHYEDPIVLQLPKYDLSCWYDRANKFIQSFNELAMIINDNMDEKEITFHSYEYAKKNYGPENLRQWFSDMNLVLFDKPDAARLANFISIYGPSNFVNRVTTRLDTQDFF